MKKIVLVALIGLTILFLGCINSPNCGNGVCSENENPQNCPEDCSTINETHSECSNEQCIEVQGTGTNQCTTNTDCEESIDDTQQFILGEKKYAIVYAFQENHPDFNSQSFTESLINNANDYFTDVSYGKVNISSGYTTTIISNEIPDGLDPCVGAKWISYTVNLVDPFINFKEYSGIIIIFETNTENPSWSCTAHATIGGTIYDTNEGKVQLYEAAFPLTISGDKPFSAPGSGILAHEIGHSFGLNHSYVLDCNDDAGNKVTIGNKCNWPGPGEGYDAVGFASMEHYSIRNKLILGWLQANNVPEVTEGTYWITPVNSQFQNKSEIKGLKIPKNWNHVEFPEVIGLSGFTHYFLEYRLINKSYLQPTKGVFIRLGRNYIEDDELTHFNNYTLLLNMHPGNSTIFTDYGAATENMYVFLEKNQSYTDQYNKMIITVLDTNESGALIKIETILY
jgi:hypothetical protein